MNDILAIFRPIKHQCQEQHVVTVELNWMLMMMVLLIASIVRFGDGTNGTQ